MISLWRGGVAMSCVCFVCGAHARAAFATGEFQLVPALAICPPHADRNVAQEISDAYAALSPPPAGTLTLNLVPGSKLLLYVGHGFEKDRNTQLCADPLPPRKAVDVMGDTPPEHRLLAILHACFSAYVDLRKFEGDTSVISASDGPVNPRAGFGQALETALRDLATTDHNCDGVVTDVEIFNRISDTLAGNIPLVKHEARPRLSAQSQLPIPVAMVAVPRPECAQQEEAVARAKAQGGDLAGAIEAQRIHDPSPSRPPLRFFRLSENAAPVDALRTALIDEGLQELPTGLADADVPLVAHHLETAEIYDVVWAGHWLKVRDLGKDHLTTREVRPGQIRQAIKSALPSQAPSILDRERPGNGLTRLLLRFRGRVPEAVVLRGIPVPKDAMTIEPCPTPTGQCFRVEVRTGAPVDEAWEKRP